MNDRQYFQTTSLSYQLKAAQRELSRFRSVEAFEQLRTDYESIIRDRNATIKKPHLTYFCECLSVLDHFATGQEDSLYRSVKEIFRRPKPVISKSEKQEIPDPALSEYRAG